ncbi:MAG: hypothetical protein ACRCXB_25040 [Aeromonadaceae bacterium]
MRSMIKKALGPVLIRLALLVLLVVMVVCSMAVAVLAALVAIIDPDRAQDVIRDFGEVLAR